MPEWFFSYPVLGSYTTCGDGKHNAYVSQVLDFSTMIDTERACQRSGTLIYEAQALSIYQLHTIKYLTSLYKLQRLPPFREKWKCKSILLDAVFATATNLVSMAIFRALQHKGFIPNPLILQSCLFQKIGVC